MWLTFWKEKTFKETVILTSSGLFFNSEDRTWMVIQHNNTELTTVHMSPGTKRHVIHFNYTSGEQQLAALISQSDRCEQELSHRCRKSRLFNTQGKTKHLEPSFNSHFWVYYATFLSFCQIKEAALQCNSNAFWLTQMISCGPRTENSLELGLERLMLFALSPSSLLVMVYEEQRRLA